MPQSIADLFVTVSSDVTGALSGLSNVDNALGRAATSMQAAVPAGLALAGAATAIGAGFVESINVASDFEHQINGIKAVMSPAEVLEFGAAVENLALKLGADTVFSSSQAAEGIEELIKAGVPLPDILNGAASAALDLAAATGVPVAQAATFAATAMNTFHLSAAELPAIMDTISNTANATATDVGGLQLAFAQIGPVAAGIGLSFNDTAQALGIFANNGLKGSDAGTSLKTMLLNLEPSTKSQVAAFKELGLITEDGSNQFFDAEGNAKGLRDIFEILKTSTAGLTAEQKINLLQTAFGTDAVRAATIAASEGAEGWDKVSESMDKMGGVAVAAAQRNQGLEGSMNRLGGSFESVQITIGNLFLPALTKIADIATDVLNAFLGLDPGLQTFIIAAVGIAGAVAGITAAAILLTPVISAAAVAFGVLTASASPFLVPILAITAAVAVLYVAWQTNFGGIQEITAAAWAVIQPGLQNIIDAFGALVGAISPVVQALGVNLMPVVTLAGDAFNWLFSNAVEGASMLGDLFNSLGAIKDLLVTGDFTGGIFGLQEDDGFIVFLLDARDAFLHIKDAVGELIGWVQNLWAQFTGGDAGGAVQGALGGILTAIQNVVAGIPNALSNLGSLIQPAISFAQGLFQNLVSVIQQSCLVAGGLFAGLVEQLGNLGGALGGAWEGVKATIGGLFAQIPGLLSGLGDPWAALVNGVWNLGPRIADALANIINFIRTTVGGIPSLITGLGDLFGPVVAAAWNIGQRLGEAVNNFFNFIRDRVTAIPATLTGLGDLFGPVVAAAWNIGQRLGEAVANFVNFATGAVAGIGTWISANAGDIFHGVIDAAWNIGQRLGEAVANFVNFATGAVAGIGTWIVANGGDIFKGVIDAAWNIGEDLGKAVANFVNFATGAVLGIGTWIVENGGDIFKGVVDAAWGIGEDLGKAVTNFTGFIGGAITGLTAWVVENAPKIFEAVVSAATALLTKLGEILGPIADVVGRIFGQVPQWFSDVFGGVGGGTGGGTTPAPGGGGTPLPGGGPLIYIATVNVTTEAEREAFFEQMSNYIAESTGRVSATITASLPSGA